MTVRWATSGPCGQTLVHRSAETRGSRRPVRRLRDPGGFNGVVGAVSRTEAVSAFPAISGRLESVGVFVDGLADGLYRASQ
jgi:hypothetical protein